MATSRKDFLLRSVLHLGAISLWLLISLRLIAAVFNRFQGVERMWRVFHYWAWLGEHSLLCPLLDCIQIGPDNDAGLSWFGLSLCAMRAPSRRHTTATDHWPPPSGIRCSGEVSRCLMTLASRNKVGSKPSSTPPPYDASAPACCWTVLWGGAGDYLCLSTPNVVRYCPGPFLPKCHNHLISFWGIELEKAVVAPVHKALSRFPVSSLASAYN